MYLKRMGIRQAKVGGGSLAIGVGIGAAIGIAAGNLAVGIGMGIAYFALFAALLGRVTR